MTFYSWAIYKKRKVSSYFYERPIFCDRTGGEVGWFWRGGAAPSLSASFGYGLRLGGIYRIGLCIWAFASESA
jgi:hypothetical protein